MKLVVVYNDTTPENKRVELAINRDVFCGNYLDQCIATKVVKSILKHFKKAEIVECWFEWTSVHEEHTCICKFSILPDGALVFNDTVRHRNAYGWRKAFRRVASFVGGVTSGILVIALLVYAVIATMLFTFEHTLPALFK